jgi:hypothetical protein
MTENGLRQLSRSVLNFAHQELVGLPTSRWISFEYGRVEELTPDALNAACWLHPTQYSNVAEHLLLGTLTRTLRGIRVWLWGPSPGNRLASWTPFLQSLSAKTRHNAPCDRTH